MGLDLINIIITAVCLVCLGVYFNYREKKLTKMADLKFLEIREKYLVQIAQRKAKEKNEIERIKALVAKLENKHKKISSLKPLTPPTEALREAEEIVRRTEKRSKQIEHEAKEKAAKFLTEQKQEVEEKMVDLVMNVTKKVLKKTLIYEEQKKLIEEAMMEVEGDLEHGSRN